MIKYINIKDESNGRSISIRRDKVSYLSGATQALVEELSLCLYADLSQINGHEDRKLAHKAEIIEELFVNLLDELETL